MHWDDSRFYMDTENTRLTCYAQTECQLAPNASVEMVRFPSLAILDAMPAVLSILENDSPRQYGIVARFCATKPQLGFVATDGFRLALSEYPLGETDYTRFDGMLIFRETCEQLLLAAKSKQEISLGVTEDRTTLAMIMGDLSAYFRTSAVKYPNYSGVIPEASIGQNFVVKELLATVKQALRTTCKKRIFKITSEQGLFTIRSRQDDTLDQWSTYQVAFPGTFEMGEKPLHLNGEYLADCLEATKEKIGKLCILSDRESPITITLGAVDTVLAPIVFDPKVKKS